MLVRAVFTSCLALAVLILAATDAAQAKIIESGSLHAGPSAIDQQALEQYLNSRAQSAPEDTRTITLNFGPLHFKEVFKHPLKACPT